MFLTDLFKKGGGGFWDTVYNNVVVSWFLATHVGLLDVKIVY